MIIDGVHIAVTREWIGDVLRLRIERQREDISQLFMITQAPSERFEGDSFIETEYGKLRVFWRNDMPKDKLAQILHLSKFRYPVKGQKLELANPTTNEAHEKHKLPTTIEDAKLRREFNDEVRQDAAQAFDELKREGFVDKHKSPYDPNGDLIH